jgi:hypothetical protein
MKKLIFLVFVLLFISVTSNSTEVKPKCDAKCYWNSQYHDCFLDATGAQCGSMSNPVPYSCYIPCNCCVVITPID